MNFFQLWSYYGTKNLLGKAWEKLVVDARRYGKPCKLQGEETVTVPCSTVSPVECARTTLAVCFLTHYFYPDKEGGTEHFVLNMAREHQRHGGMARVITLSVQPKTHYPHLKDGVLWRDYEVDGVPVTEFRYEKTPVGLYYKRMESQNFSLQQFAHYIFDRESFDLVHCAFPQPFCTFLMVCRERKIPYGITHTGFGVFCHYTTRIDSSGTLCPGSEKGERCKKYCKTYGVDGYGQRYKTALEMVCGAAFLTAPASFVARWIGEELGQNQVYVLPHGIGEEFSSSLRKHGKRMMYAGTLTQMKGIHLLVQAFMRLSDGEATLDIYGSGDERYRKTLEKMANKDKRIHFYSRRYPGDMPKLYQTHDVVVVPSVVPETYNFVVREALRCNCLGVVAEIGALPEAIVDGKNGFCFVPGEEDSLMRALEKALTFSWDNYIQVEFPTVEEEYRRYVTLYGKAVSDTSI